MQTKINKQTKNSWQLQNTFIHRSKTPKKNNTHKHILQQIHHHNNLHIYPLHLQPPPKKNGPYMVYAKKRIFQLPIEIPNPRHQAVVSPAILPRSSPRWWNAGRPASKTWPRPGAHGLGTKDSPMVALRAGEFIGDHGTFGCHVITINSSVTNYKGYQRVIVNTCQVLQHSQFQEKLGNDVYSDLHQDTSIQIDSNSNKSQVV